MENNSFEYTYSAQQQREVEAIRRKYLPQEQDKMDELRKLHSIPTKKAQAAAIASGVLGTLVLGTGMSLCMTDIGRELGQAAWAVGILVGIVGIAMIAMAYPVFKRTLDKERKRIAPDILKLTDELLR